MDLVNFARVLAIFGLVLLCSFAEPHIVSRDCSSVMFLFCGDLIIL